MRRVWKRLLGLCDRTVLEAVEYDEDDEAIVASVRPRRPKRQRCGKCGLRAPGYDEGEGRRRWRTLDLGVLKAYLEAEAPRVACPEHGVTVIQVPWARHDARFTYEFEQQVAWLAVNTSKSAVKELMRIAWASVGRIIERVSAAAKQRIDPLEGLVRIGIDEVAYRKGHCYLTVIVDHDTGRLVWAAPGANKKTLGAFFDALGEEGRARIRLISADGAEWIARLATKRCPNATLCLDPFHVCKWASDALDEVRREVWNEARRSGQKALAKELKGARFALWKKPGDLTDKQQAKLAFIQQTNSRLYRAYLLKEQLRLVFHQDSVDEALELLDGWLAWACRSRIPAFVKLSRTVRAQREAIKAALEHALSNARVEGVNTRVKLLARVAFGFHTPEALIALAMLALGGLCPPLPGRTRAQPALL